jgi:hypothetical protein
VSFQKSTREGLLKYKAWHEEKAAGENLSEEGQQKFKKAADMIQEDINYIDGFESMVNSKVALSKPYFPMATIDTAAPPLPITLPERVRRYCGRK